jgi:hypothetical protein
MLLFTRAGTKHPRSVVLWDSLPAGSARLSTFSMTEPTACRQGPMVRIHLPPAVSLLRSWLSGAVRKIVGQPLEVDGG